MKTTIDILENIGVVTSPVSGLQTYLKADVQAAMIEYGKQLLIEASERATITLKDVYSEDFTIVKDEIVRYNPKGVNSVYPDDCFKHSMKINSESILNIINELK